MKNQKYAKATVAIYAKAGKALFDKVHDAGSVSLLEAKQVMNKNQASMKVVDAAVKLGLFNISGQNVAITNGYTREDIGQKLANHFSVADDKRPTVPHKRKNAIKKAGKKAGKKLARKQHAPAKKIKPLRDITVNSYAKAIDILRKKLKKPVHMSSQEFAKKQKISTNLMIALVDKKYVKKTREENENRFQWVGPNALNGKSIARRVLSYLNSKVYVNAHQSPAPKAVAKAAAKKPTVKSSNKPQPKATKPAPVQTPKREREPLQTDAGIKLAKRWTELGHYDSALAVLDKITPQS